MDTACKDKRAVHVTLQLKPLGYAAKPTSSTGLARALLSSGYPLAVRQIMNLLTKSLAIVVGAAVFWGACAPEQAWDGDNSTDFLAGGFVQQRGSYLGIGTPTDDYDLCEPFRSYVQVNGGVEALGKPVRNPVTSDRENLAGDVVQYLEYAKLVYDPAQNRVRHVALEYVSADAPTPGQQLAVTEGVPANPRQGTIDSGCLALAGERFHPGIPVHFAGEQQTLIDKLRAQPAFASGLALISGGLLMATSPPVTGGAHNVAGAVVAIAGVIVAVSGIVVVTKDHVLGSTQIATRSGRRIMTPEEVNERHDRHTIWGDEQPRYRLRPDGGIDPLIPLPNPPDKHAGDECARRIAASMPATQSEGPPLILVCALKDADTVFVVPGAVVFGPAHVRFSNPNALRKADKRGRFDVRNVGDVIVYLETFSDHQLDGEQNFTRYYPNTGKTITHRISWHDETMSYSIGERGWGIDDRSNLQHVDLMPRSYAQLDLRTSNLDAQETMLRASASPGAATFLPVVWPEIPGEYPWKD